MEREENGQEVPELTRRTTLCSCRRDPARALVPVLTAMPEHGIPLGDILDDSGYSHSDTDAWYQPSSSISLMTSPTLRERQDPENDSYQRWPPPDLDGSAARGRHGVEQH